MNPVLMVAEAGLGDVGGRSNRLMVQQILLSSRYLPLRERSIIQSVYEFGMPVATIARAWGRDPIAVRRLLKRVIKRIVSPEFRYVMRHGSSWDGDTRAIAEAVFLRGYTQRQTAAMLNTTVHRVRKECEVISALSAAMRKQELNKARCATAM